MLLILGVAITAFGVAVAAWGIAHVRPIIGTIFAAVGSVLAAAAGVLLFVFSGVSIQSPIIFPSKQQSTLKIISQFPIERPSSDSTASALLAAVQDENAKLKTENTRLKNRPVRTIVERPAPSPCPSATQVLLPSKISATDCYALIGEQKEVDNADHERIDAIKTLGSGGQTNQQMLQTTQQGIEAKATEEQATANLQGLIDRLCAPLAVSTPTAR